VNPEWNQSGPVIEGSSRLEPTQTVPVMKQTFAKQRPNPAIRTLVQNGVQTIRTHADTTDPGNL